MPFVNSDSLRRSWIALFIAITSWSLSPFLIFESSGLAPSPVVALFAVALGSTIALLISVPSATLNVRAVIRANRSQRTVGRAAILGVGAFVAYPLLYFSALQGAHSIVLVNLTNYLWPVVAMAVVALALPRDRSLETILAVGFGFTGAALAIAAAHPHSTQGSNQFAPFLLAGLGAVVYGSVSAYMRIDRKQPENPPIHLLLLALFVGGLVSYLGLGILAIAHPAWVSLHHSAHGNLALITYALLLPAAHLSWLTAVRDARVPTLPAAFVIPVTGTAILALAVGGHVSPTIVSALVLVLCGVAFANIRQRTIPVGFAVTLGFLASIQLSQGLAGKIHGTVSVETGQLALILVALLAIFGGFVLTNAIHRHDELQRCCANFYGKLIGNPDLSPAQRFAALDRLDALVLRLEGTTTGYVEQSGDHTPDRDTGTSGTITRVRVGLGIDAGDAMGPTLASVEGETLAARGLFPEEWAKLDVALANKVSNYEWLVLTLGTVGLTAADQLYAVDSRSPATILIRAFTIALMVGVVFTIRDYDRHRPIRLAGVLTALRNGFVLPIDEHSPLSKVSRASASQGLGVWEIMGLVLLVASALVAITLNLGA